jgi:prolyl-tRNA synthetase
MRYARLFPKTKKTAPKGAESVNHKLLVRAGCIDQLMAGSWTLLPLGWRVVVKINQIIREEMDAIGGQEMLMPLLHPKDLWNETGRWDKAADIMYKLKDQREREYALSFTHEEIVMDLLRKHVQSYEDLPVAVYHFSTKFRNEPRARSGILRGREFMMKDLYSAHRSEADLLSYYETVKHAYGKIFQRLGLDVRVTEAAGGVFTDRKTHEFQVLSDGGEDTIYYCGHCDWGANKELVAEMHGEQCPQCGSSDIRESKAIEVGNIFPLGTWYAEKMHVYFTDESGKRQPVWFGSYGIGPTRVLGALVEVSHDARGIIWFPQVAPYDVHLVSLPNAEKRAGEVYEALTKAGVDVLWDDRHESAGVKFADADLIGIPIRLVVSKKTGSHIEYKRREREETELLTLEEVQDRLQYTKK